MTFERTAAALPFSSIPDGVRGLQELWNETAGDPRICIAVLDGPVDLAHPCFAGAQLEAVETLVSGVPGDDLATQHGTHVASVIFGRRDSAVRGIAPDCRGLIVPIYSPRAGDDLACSQLDLARAINLAAVRGANIINISGGELAPGGEAEPMLADAIRRCSESGVLIVAAAGNDGCRCLHVPAAVPSVLAVGAMDARGSALPFSNWGSAYEEQGLLALGEAITGATAGGGVMARTGTSFATPVVSAIAALLMSRQLAQSGRFDAQAVRDVLLESAEACDPGAVVDCRRLLGGRLNLPAARVRLQQQSIRTATVLTVAPTAAAEALSASVIQTFARGVITNERGMHMSEHVEAIETPVNGNAAYEENRPGPVAGPFTSLSASPLLSASAGVMPSDIRPSCPPAAVADAPPALAYVLGQLGYDFGSESRRDQFLQLTNRNVHDPEQFLSVLQQDPVSAASVIWTLSIDATVVYAIAPAGPFASVIYERLRDALRAQLVEGADRVSIPGLVKGTVRLLNGQVVPYLYPDARGVYSWTTPSLVEAVIGAEPEGEKAATAHQATAEGIQNFLDRIYYEVRNLGLMPQERAVNYAATNAFQLEFIYRHAVVAGMKLDSIDVERSPIGRPGSDCWDVKLTFFDPARRLERARHVYRFTVDVSDVIPVTVGKVREWDVY